MRRLLGVWRRVSHAQRRWEIPDGRIFAPARTMFPVPCGWDSRLHTDPVFNGTGFIKHTHSRASRPKERNDRLQCMRNCENARMNDPAPRFWVMFLWLFALTTSLAADGVMSLPTGTTPDEAWIMPGSVSAYGDRRVSARGQLALWEPLPALPWHTSTPGVAFRYRALFGRNRSKTGMIPGAFTERSAVVSARCPPGPGSARKCATT